MAPVETRLRHGVSAPPALVGLGRGTTSGAAAADGSSHGGHFRESRLEGTQSHCEARLGQLAKHLTAHAGGKVGASAAEPNVPAKRSGAVTWTRASALVLATGRWRGFARCAPHCAAHTMRPRTMKMSAATREKSMLQSVQYVANVTWPSLTLHAWGLKVRGASSDRKMALDITFM